ncbi:MAG: RdgB/HAM1 family non-canonical purine NTP pyrophosphatase [Eggerthellaceae bacterium]|nr:RdgB/HAM1 family non-canonical purine NTP pyrophosphatase [Eggerthellaceae bacterium]
MPKTVLIASNNAHKVAEISDALAFTGWHFVSLKEAGIVSDPEETGTTFAENARIKALAAHEASGGMASLADDSGLAVDALDGAPGIFSARYAGDHGHDKDNNDLVLKNLGDLAFEKRTARFVCALAFVDEDGSELSALGKVEGRIGYEERGEAGFGYDPLFWPEEYNWTCTFAEVPMAEKAKISHRGRALRELAAKIAARGEQGAAEKTPARKPRIGIPLRSAMESDGRGYGYLFDSIRRPLQRAGALLVPIPGIQDIDYWPTNNAEWPALTAEEKADVEAMLDMLDGLFLPGGYKFCEYDRYVLERAIARDLPVLGVCMGMQIMSCRGKDEISLRPVSDEAVHCNRVDKYAHKVTVAPDSKLWLIVGQGEFPVNSWHKRQVSERGTYRPVAWSEDGVIEAMELPTATFNIGVQWHPEALYGIDEPSTRLIDAFIDACR